MPNRHGVLRIRNQKSAGGRRPAQSRVGGRIIRLTALASLLLLSNPIPQQAHATPLDAAEIIRRHRAALGGEEAIRSIVSVRTSATIEFAGTGLSGTMESVFMRPCLSYNEISLGMFNVQQGYDGDRIWRVDQNGKLQLQLDPASQRNQVTTCFLETYGYLFPGEGDESAAAGPDSVNGVPCEVVELHPAGGNTCRIYFDRRDFLIRQIIIDAPEGTIAQLFDDYRSVGGVMMAFSTITRHLALHQEVTVRTETVTINQPVDPLVFLPPATDVRDFRFIAQTEDILFDYVGGHIYLPVRVGDGGRKERFLLDSGAGMTVIDSALAADMELPLGGAIPGAGAVGTTEFHITRLPALGISGIEFDEQTVIAYPLSTGTARLLEMDIGGILGYDFLSRFVTKIDFERRRLSFFDPDSYTPDSTAVAVDAPLIHNIFSLEARLDGTYEGTFLIDTGANSSLLLQAFVEAHQLLRDREALEISILGAGGAETAHISRFESFEFGGQLLEAPVFAMHSSKEGIGAFEEVSGIIGNNILARFTVTFDYKNQRLYLERNNNYSKPFHPDHSGLVIALSNEGRVMIHTVVPRSPAWKAGLRHGDEILSIDDRDVKDYGDIDEIYRLFRAAPGTARNITIRRNGKHIEVTIVLERYI